MRFTTTKEKILQASLITERLVSKKESLPVLSCVLVRVEKSVVLASTNLEAGVEVQVPGEVLSEGSVAVPASVLTQALKSITTERVTCMVKDNNLALETKNTKTLIKAVPHDEFPPIPKLLSSSGVSIKKEAILKGISAVSYAASPSMIRQELGSVYFSLSNGELVLVATDSFRLAEKVLRGVVGGGDMDILLPLKHVVELQHILEHVRAEEILLTIGETQCMVSADSVQFVSRVVDGTFPNYKEIVPKIFQTEVTTLKEDLVEVLKKARVFAGSDQNVGLHIYPQKKIFTITAQSADIGEMSDSIDAALSGDDIDISFHIGYLADCLSSIESDSITLNFSGTGKPLVIRGVSDHSFTYLVMPLNR